MQFTVPYPQVFKVWFNPAATPKIWGMFSQSEALQFRKSFLDRIQPGFLGIFTLTKTPSNWGMFSQSEVLQFKYPFLDRINPGFEQPPGTLSYVTGYQYQSPDLQFKQRFLDRIQPGFEQPPGTLSYVTGYQYQSPVVFQQPVLRLQQGFTFLTTVAVTPTTWGMFSQSEVKYAQPFPAASQQWSAFSGVPTIFITLGYRAVNIAVAKRAYIYALSPFVFFPGVAVTPGNWGMFSQSEANQFKQLYIDKSQYAWVQPPGTLSYVTGYQYQSPDLQFKQLYVDKSQYAWVQPPGTLSYVTGYQYQSPDLQFKQPFLDRIQPGFEQPPGTLSYVTGYQYQSPDLQIKGAFLDRIQPGFIFTPTAVTTPSSWGMFSQSEANQFKQPFLDRIPPGFVTPAVVQAVLGYRAVNTAVVSFFWVQAQSEFVFTPAAAVTIGFSAVNTAIGIRPIVVHSQSKFVFAPTFAVTPSNWGMFSQSEQYQIKLTFLDRIQPGFIFTPTFAVTPSNWGMFSQSEQYQIKLTFLDRIQPGFIFTPTATATPSNWGMFSQSPVQYAQPFINRGQIGFEQPPGTLSFQWGFQGPQPVVFQLPFLDRSMRNWVQPPGTLSFFWGFQGPQPVVFQLPFIDRSQYAWVQPPGTLSFQWGFQGPQPVVFQLPFLDRSMRNWVQPPGTLSFFWGFQGPQPNIFRLPFLDRLPQNIIVPAVTTPTNWGMFSQSEVKYAQPFPAASQQWSAFGGVPTIFVTLGYRAVNIGVSKRFFVYAQSPFGIITPTPPVATPTTWGMFSQSEVKYAQPFPAASQQWSAFGGVPTIRLTLGYRAVNIGVVRRPSIRAFSPFEFLPTFAVTPSNWGMFAQSPVQFKAPFVQREIKAFWPPSGTLSYFWGFQGPFPFSVGTRQYRAMDAFLRFVVITVNPQQWGMFSQSPDYFRRFDLRNVLVDSYKPATWRPIPAFTGTGFLTAKWLDRLHANEVLSASTWIELPTGEQPLLKITASNYTDISTEISYSNAIQGHVYKFLNYIITSQGRVMKRIIFTPLAQFQGFTPSPVTTLFTISKLCSSTDILCSSTKLVSLA